ncbi:hypothetical protein FCL40_05030 [Ferrimonas sediminicola]|uniref:Uncharacterized protein n=1 Tax=Ferrimonas sediminicola TaxID=2569538 RepID=A0A4U1BIA9_9GAMM|nr:hypothetical protein [Ferrimonas sediminicola]TKB50516.1 hypothetical protein FCL40_05030 [Ferrimonas sediminicola]
MSDKMIKSSIATVQQGVAKADGRLWLSEQQIGFEPFNHQFGLGPYRFARSEVAESETCLGKGAGVLPITTDAIRLTLADGRVFEFLVAHPREWLEALAPEIGST